MVGVEAGPDVVAHSHDALGHVLLHAPALVGLVGRKNIQKVVVEASLVPSNQVNLVLLFDPAHMLPVLETGGVGHTLAPKCLIDHNFVVWRVLEAALGHGGAAAVDAVDS